MSQFEKITPFQNASNLMERQVLNTPKTFEQVVSERHEQMRKYAERLEAQKAADLEIISAAQARVSLANQHLAGVKAFLFEAEKRA